jgi:hypothetical protein
MRSASPGPLVRGGVTQKEKLVWLPIFIVDAINIGHGNKFMFLENIGELMGILVNYSKRKVGLVRNIYC